MGNLTSAWTLAVGSTGAVITFIAGGHEHLFKILLTMMVIDIVTGLTKGVKNRNLKSSIMSMGIFKKGAIITAIFFAGQLDLLFEGQLDSLLGSENMTFAAVMIWLAIGHESLSIIENLEKLGAPIPEPIRKVVDSMANKDNEDDKEEKQYG